MILTSRMQLTRIEVAAQDLLRARTYNYAYACEGFLNGDQPKPTHSLKLAENEFWKACRALIADDRTGRRQ